MARALARYVRPIVERSPLLAQTYRHYRDGRGLQREPVTTPWGFRFVGHPLMEQGRFEPDEVRVVERLLDGSDLLVNIGANIGYYCCIALHRGKRVLAFEPVPGNLQYLYRNLRVNGWESDAEVMPVAVGDRSGLVDIFGGGTAASLINGWAGLSENHRQTVPLTTLDTALGERFESQRLFVLMDVEGAEIDVLRGARRLLYRQPRPVWMVEVNIDEHQPHGRCINPHLAATFEMFERAGYAAWLVGPALTAVSYDEVREIARTGVNTLAGHNFVFADPAMSQFC